VDTQTPALIQTGWHMHYIQTGTITSSDMIVTTRQLARYTQTSVGELVSYTTTITIAAHTVARGVPKRIYHWRLEGLESGPL
jgi:hypothetical protein